MYRSALRSASRPVAMMRSTSTVLQSAVPRRFASTASPVNKSKSWKGSALRWGLAGAAVYYYNTSPVFADELPAQTLPAPSSFLESDLPTVDSVIEQKRKEISQRAAKHQEPAAPAPSEAKESEPEISTHTDNTAVIEGSPEALEEEAGQQGAFNPETGEINWDCPCLGGMAHGPCGEEFKTAFSCFVYSNEEPKGMDCIEKFQGMQECFRKYPEVYGAELADEEAAEAAESDAPIVPEDQQALRETAPASESEVKTNAHETDNLPGVESLAKEPQLPKWEDATPANKEVKEEEKEAEKKKE